jgi:hypothetical protein
MSLWFLLISDFGRVLFSCMKITKNTRKIASFPIVSTLTLSRLYLFSALPIFINENTNNNYFLFFFNFNLMLALLSSIKITENTFKIASLSVNL